MINELIARSSHLSHVTSSPSLTNPLRYRHQKWVPCLVHPHQKLLPTIITISLFLALKSICALSRKPLMGSVPSPDGYPHRQVAFFFSSPYKQQHHPPLPPSVHPLMRFLRMRMIIMRSMLHWKSPQMTTTNMLNLLNMCFNLQAFPASVTKIY